MSGQGPRPSGGFWRCSGHSREVAVDPRRQAPPAATLREQEADPPPPGSGSPLPPGAEEADLRLHSPTPTLPR